MLQYTIWYLTGTSVARSHGLILVFAFWCVFNGALGLTHCNRLRGTAFNQNHGTMESWMFDLYIYQTIHSRRGKIFTIFDPYPPPVGKFLILFVGTFGQFLTPPLPRICKCLKWIVPMVNIQQYDKSNIISIILST